MVIGTKFWVILNNHIEGSIPNCAKLYSLFEQPVVLYFHQGWQLCIGALVPILPPVEELPTLEQFRYWYLKECNLKCPMIVHEDKLIYQKGE